MCELTAARMITPPAQVCARDLLGASSSPENGATPGRQRCGLCARRPSNYADREARRSPRSSQPHTSPPITDRLEPAPIWKWSSRALASQHLLGRSRLASRRARDRQSLSPPLLRRRPVPAPPLWHVSSGSSSNDTVLPGVESNHCSTMAIGIDRRVGGWRNFQFHCEGCCERASSTVRARDWMSRCAISWLAERATHTLHYRFGGRPGSLVPSAPDRHIASGNCWRHISERRRRRILRFSCVAGDAGATINVQFVVFFHCEASSTAPAHKSLPTIARQPHPELPDLPSRSGAVRRSISCSWAASVQRRSVARCGRPRVHGQPGHWPRLTHVRRS